MIERNTFSTTKRPEFTLLAKIFFWKNGQQFWQEFYHKWD